MRDTPAFDDEDLWFPAHMSAGDSFSRPLAADGAATGTATGTASLDDGIGLPRRRPGTISGAPRRRKAQRTTKAGGVKASSWLWLTVWGAAALGIATYAARKEIVIELAQGWLKGQGVPARLHFDTLSLGHASGRFILGNPDRPDLSAGRFDVDFSLNLFAGGGRPLARLKTARLDRVGLHLSYKDGRLGFGTLDRLIHNPAMKMDSSPSAVTVGDASVVVDSDYGTLRGHGSAAFRDGRLSYLSVKLPAARLDGTRGGGDLAGADILVRAAEANALQVEARANAAELDLRDGSRVVEGAPAHPIQAQGVTLDISGQVPYRETGDLSGPLDAVIAVTAHGVRAQGLTLADADYRIKLDGHVGNGTPYEGAADVAAHFGRVATRGLEARRVAVTASGKAHVAAGSVRLTGTVDAAATEMRRPGVALTRARLRASRFTFTADATGRHGDFTGAVTADHMEAGDLDLSHARASINGAVDSDASSGAWRAGLETDLDSAGSYTGLRALARGRTSGDDLSRLDRGLDQFTLKASGISLTLEGQGSGPADIDLRLKAPAQAALAGGLTIDLLPRDGAPILASQTAGALGVSLKGGPVVALDLSNLVLSRHGAITGDYALDGSFSVAPVAGARVLAKGHLSTAEGLTATLAQPLTFSAQSANFGETFTHLSGMLGEAGNAGLHVDASGWRVEGAYTGLTLQAPNERLMLKAGQGTLYAGSGGLRAGLDTAVLSDASPGTQRFYPMTLSGTLTQNGHAQTGRFTAAVQSRPVLAISLDNDTVTGRGHLGLRTLGLTFAPGALQPRDLSPVGSAILARQVSGALSFDGDLHWDRGRRSSSGLLRIDGLNFSGAMGTAEALRGEVDFTSLAPLQSAPGQVLGIHRMQAGLPLDDLVMSLQVQGDHIFMDKGTANTPGGPVRLEPMTVPFDPRAPVTGAIAFDGLDFGKIVRASDLAGSLTFEGRLSGRVPFSILGGHAAFGDGSIRADGPGTIAIRRQALTGVVASGSLTGEGQARAAALPLAGNPFQDLAYQAMEHLQYDRLDAQIHAQPNGGIDALLHVEGRFAPPSPRQSRVNLEDYRDGAWAAKPLALPSDTPVDLYLDVPLAALGAR